MAERFSGLILNIVREERRDEGRKGKKWEDVEEGVQAYRSPPPRAQPQLCVNTRQRCTAERGAAPSEARNPLVLGS